MNEFAEQMENVKEFLLKKRVQAKARDTGVQGLFAGFMA